MALPEPLDALLDLIEMLIQGTDNVWLDSGKIGLIEGCGYPQWDPIEVVYLSKEWQKAEPNCEAPLQILDHIHCFIALDCSPGHRERAKFQTWLDLSFEETTILFNQVVHIVIRPSFTCFT